MPDAIYKACRYISFHTTLQTQSDAYEMAHQPAREPTVELADIFLLDVFH